MLLFEPCVTIRHNTTHLLTLSDTECFVKYLCNTYLSEENNYKVPCHLQFVNCTCNETSNKQKLAVRKHKSLAQIISQNKTKAKRVKLVNAVHNSWMEQRRTSGSTCNNETINNFSKGIENNSETSNVCLQSTYIKVDPPQLFGKFVEASINQGN